MVVVIVKCKLNTNVPLTTKPSGSASGSNATDSEDSNKKKDDGLSDGAIAGAVVGGIAGFGVVGTLVAYSAGWIGSSATASMMMTSPRYELL